MERRTAFFGTFLGFVVVAERAIVERSVKKTSSLAFAKVVMVE